MGYELVIAEAAESAELKKKIVRPLPAPAVDLPQASEERPAGNLAVQRRARCAAAAASGKPEPSANCELETHPANPLPQRDPEAIPPPN